MLQPLLAVHIADLVLGWPWVVGGWVGLGVLFFLGAWRIREDEVPRVALLTAAFFVASSLHIPLGPASAHLLLNGLVGVLLGWRAALAIPLGLAMQAALLGHGGYSTIGINSVIMTIPALLACPGFALLQRTPGVCRPWFRGLLVGVSACVLLLSLVNAGCLLYGKLTGGTLDLAAARTITFHPGTLSVVVLVSALAALAETQLDHAPEFPLGLLVGELSVLATVALHTAVLILGGEQDWQAWALLDLLIHLPIAVIEGVIVGFTVGFLVRVKPEMLGWTARGDAV
ncbi:MAG: energy-coupling factor ABC transporter permease [Planctomycetia bacterium]|nr:energy-coupling factor ABC transporter permease [Planctomycetia bacterium]